MLTLLFFLYYCSTNAFDSGLLSNIQKLFSERIEIFSSVEFSKVSVLTGIVKIALKVNVNAATRSFFKDLGKNY